MKPFLSDNNLTPLLYLSKASSAQSCPMRYYWSHHCHLQAGQRPDYFKFGSAIHKAVEIALTHSFPIAEAVLCDRLDLAIDLGLKPELLVPKPQLKGSTEPPKTPISDITTSSDADKALMLNMLEAFELKWNASGVIELLSTEESVCMPLSELGIQSSRFTHWVAKADFVFEDMEGVWVGDLKSTSGYGPSTAKYYHSSPQTKTYFHILNKHDARLRGTKIFVVTKQKVRCEIEPILINDNDHHQAQLFIENAVRQIEEIEDALADGKEAVRCMTSCVSHLGQECPYIPLCINLIKDEAYAMDLVTNWYKIESPDLHLELD